MESGEQRPRRRERNLWQRRPHNRNKLSFQLSIPCTTSLALFLFEYKQRRSFGASCMHTAILFGRVALGARTGHRIVGVYRPRVLGRVRRVWNRSRRASSWEKQEWFWPSTDTNNPPLRPMCLPHVRRRICSQRSCRTYSAFCGTRTWARASFSFSIPSLRCINVSFERITERSWGHYSRPGSARRRRDGE